MKSISKLILRLLQIDKLKNDYAEIRFESMT